MANKSSNMSSEVCEERLQTLVQSIGIGHVLVMCVCCTHSICGKGELYWGSMEEINPNTKLPKYSC